MIVDQVVAGPGTVPLAKPRDARFRRLDPWRRLPRSGYVGLVTMVLMLLFGLAGPWAIGVDPEAQDLTTRLQPPIWSGGTWERPLGTDQLGRDLLARIAAGTQTSLLISAAVTGLASIAGVMLGVLAGLGTRRVDRVLVFMVDVTMAVPVFVLAVVVSALFEPGIAPTIAVLTLTGWVGYQRVARSQVQMLRQSEFVEASRAIGGDSWWVGRKHIVPNSWGPILVLASQQVSAVVLFEAGLSYLGLGVPQNVITLGGLIAGGREVLFAAWWVPTIPGVAIAILALGFMLTADGLAEMFSPGRRSRSWSG